MKCHWCERETTNQVELIINGFFDRVLVVFCDRCKEAQRQADDPQYHVKPQIKCKAALH